MSVKERVSVTLDTYGGICEGEGSLRLEACSEMLSYMKHILPLHCFQEEMEMVVAVQLVQ